MEVTHKVDRSGVLKVSAGKRTGKRKGNGISGVRKKRVERQKDQGEYAQEGQHRMSLNKVEQVRKKVMGLSGEDGLLYHGKAETISAAAAPTKVSASSRVGKIEAQLQPMLKLRREMLA
ncbi:hypothetical protein O181_080327 [Austropuccinia psidii MF-1]|uniref:Uncharacterized protein n=1 Tax=Austropuccinia psidii MF-1 TaxID=1389203 RepID=A0A9Q3IHC1_9BASI|nr:hypothetical protein [Austropuccinia psidii MF-1]